MKITIKRKQRQTRLGLPRVSNLRDAGAKNIKGLIGVAGATLMLWSCDVTDPIYDTPHPNHGQITLITDWSQIGTGITAPANYTVKVGDYTATVSENPKTIDNLFVPGTYHANIHNTAEKITIGGTTATVAAVNVPAGASGAFIDPLPGWFFTWAGDQTIEKDKDYDITAVMKQQVRELNLVIEPTGGTVERIAGITATLSGVASQLNIDNSAASTAANIAPVFTKATDGKYKATVRLLDITGSSQKLKITVTYTDGTPPEQLEEYELGTALAGFGTDKKTPLTLGAQAIETPTGAGFAATISPWEKVAGTGVAN